MFMQNFGGTNKEYCGIFENAWPIIIKFAELFL